MLTTKYPTGFSLIELIVVIAVIAILASIAIPSYIDSVRKGHRSDAIVALMNAQLALEKYRVTNPTYAGAAVAATSPEGHYDIVLSNASATTYTLTATATGDQAKDSCGSFVLNQNGRDTTGSNADDRCWGQ